MIRVLKFMEKMWLMLCIITFIIALYWTFQDVGPDALYFYLFSVVSIILFVIRRKQRKAYERKKPSDK